MAVSAVGQGIPMSRVRYAAAGVLALLVMLGYLYGPPRSPGLSEMARHSCNELTGGDFRGFSLRWETTTHRSVSRPQWVCYDLGTPGHPGTELGWWASR